MVLIGKIIGDREKQAKAMMKTGEDPKVIARKTGVSLMWIELQYRGRQ